MPETYPTLSVLPSSAGFSEDMYFDPTIVSNSEAGYQFSRPRFTRIPYKWTLPYNMMPDNDKMKLKTFERHTVVSGGNTFYWANPYEYNSPLAIRTSLTAYKVGDIVRPATANSHSYRCTTAGTTAASPPTFPTTIGGTVTDGTVVWTENTYECRLVSPIKYRSSEVHGYWDVEVVLAET